MSLYMVQASYTSQAIAAMVRNPQDRATALRPVIERLGGKLHGAWLSLGEYDVVVLAELPDQVSAVSIAASVGATGAMSKYLTTPLLTTEESMKAFSMAGGVGYKPPA
jgi:uncharacterized protein with GYD domain